MLELMPEILKFLVQDPENFDIHGIKHTIFKIFGSVIQISGIAPDFSKSRVDPVNLKIE